MTSTTNEIRVLTPIFPPEVSVVVATFGNSEWQKRGLDKALDTFLTQSHVPETIWVHDETLAKARNHGAAIATTDWLVFLDADDKLDPSYCGVIGDGDGDVLQPSVRGFRGDQFIEDAPVFRPKKHPLIRQNFLTIGAPIRSSLFFAVGGFDEWPCLEDWAFWLKCEKAGAKFGVLPQAVYLINDEHYRNLGDHFHVTQQIRAEYK